MRLLLAVLATAPAALAQRTWVVDVNNGPGTDFFDIPPAVAAAAPGDLIVVRAGQYNGFSTNKGLRMVGEGAVLLAPSAPGGKALIVDG
ncbi:MAG TPA: hypothetical protein VK081_03410, partial [Planctomycetota bacterium]|nr:hypothetical protein [Planctomycetota bacterium]